ncbi:PadR family transcriptional regulator [Streptosporangium pseudovulgare]|uniref:PadR family transcriptional regulator n=1 Tax=Streptosporangium pseudovulgare TaxID=35765 RepID=A0ABQ2R7M9_9ACTN|nr:PadR family transcriptional regulator [Streptosporangium pseudovulgare]GGQ15181.1 PadR family transcriptional regulator [Streptosporangium pseudovulgare]
MTKRRKVSNMLGLAVLSAVVAKPMHPYEIASVLRERGKDRDMKIKWGSLYTVVRNLEKHGFLAVTGTVRDGAHPERTIYRITDAGRREYADWTRELLAEPDRDPPRFEAGLSVMGVIHPDEVAVLLRRRLDALDREIGDQREALAGCAGVPRLFLVEAEFDLAMREAEAAWTRSLLEELVTGSFPGLPAWREWHETGRMPAEIAALAEGAGRAGRPGKEDPP